MPTHIPAITIFFLRHDPAPTEIYTLSLHDALPIFCFSRVISSGPKVSGRLAPILTPVQPLSLCEAVTIATQGDRKSTRLNSSHSSSSYAVFCLKQKREALRAAATTHQRFPARGRRL